MQTERKEIYSIRREFGWLFLVAGVAGIVFMGVLLFRQRRYNLISAVITLFACLPFYFAYEKREGSIRRMVMLAVMTAMTVTGRCVFAPVPYFKPTISIVILSGLYMGPEAGFLVGSLSAVISNIFFGQGPWTPWQMFAYGIGGLLAGLLARKGIMTEKKRIRTAVIGFLIILCIVGPLLDTCSVFTMVTNFTRASVGAIYMSGLPVNIVHGVATALTLLILCKPMMEKLERIRIKYGMMGEEDEI